MAGINKAGLPKNPAGKSKWAAEELTRFQQLCEARASQQEQGGSTLVNTLVKLEGPYFTNKNLTRRVKLKCFIQP